MQNPYRRAALLVFLSAVVLAPVGAELAGRVMAERFLHPRRIPLGPRQIANANAHFARVHARQEDFTVRAADGALLRGWKVRPQPNDVPAREGAGDWVLLLHGSSDNRAGMSAHAEMLLRHGYNVLMMDSRAQGESEGRMVTYGWQERYDVQAIVKMLRAKEMPHCIFALGESMGAVIALLSGGIEARIDGVVAESAFQNLREVSYDYSGLRISPLLGRTLFRPVAITGIRAMEKEGGFRAADISPESAVAARAFPVLLICGLRDRNIPPRHSQAIYDAATGSKELWLVPRTGHTQALWAAPQEFEMRVISFFQGIHNARPAHSRNVE